MQNFGLYMILTRPGVGHVAAAEVAVRLGVRMLQLREKQAGGRELLRLARELRAVTRGTQTRLIINDRPDIAVLARADGVHVGQEDIGVEQVRQIVGREMIVGLSTHSVAQAREAQGVQGVDYIGFGPVYATTTKAVPDPGVGTALLSEVIGFSRVPVVAIGGIFPENLDTVVRAGGQNPCLVRYLMEPTDREELARRVAGVQKCL